MKKKDLGKLALIGISSGLLVSSCQKDYEKRDQKTQKNALVNRLESNTEMKDFYFKLSPPEQELFAELDESHRKLAVEMLHQLCAYKNLCRGLGGGENAGLNDCKGLGGSPITSADEAVRAQYRNQMQQQRYQMTRGLTAPSNSQ